MNTYSVSSSIHYHAPLSKLKPSKSNTSSSKQVKHDVIITLPSHIKSITSTSNPFVKHCVKLGQSSSYRHSHGSVVVVGSTPIREITRFQDGIEEGPSIFQCLLLLDGAEVPQEFIDSSVRVVHVSSMVMRKLSGVQSKDAIQAVALLHIPNSFCLVDENHEEENFQSWFSCPHRILVLDGIQDPGNLGTLLRSAVAFRWDGVFLLPGCCDPFNDKALRASRGACFQLPIVSGNWEQLENLRKGFQMKMLAGHPESKNSAPLSQKLVDSLIDKHVCLILGSEGLGLSEQSELTSELVSIPMAGDYESLNVSVAGGIFLFMLQPRHYLSN